MTDSKLIRVNPGAANARILARSVKVDFRYVEAASVKVTTHFTSADAKRHFVRYFHTLQLNAHFISVVARTKLKAEDITRAESSLRDHLMATAAQLNAAIDHGEALLKANGIASLAAYNTLPLQLEVGIISSAGMRYFDIMNKFDQLMQLLQTLEIHHVVTAGENDVQRGVYKRKLRKLAVSARRAATALRQQMQGGAGVNKSRDSDGGDVPG